MRFTAVTPSGVWNVWGGFQVSDVGGLTAFLSPLTWGESSVVAYVTSDGGGDVLQQCLAKPRHEVMEVGVFRKRHILVVPEHKSGGGGCGGATCCNRVVAALARQRRHDHGTPAGGVTCFVTTA